ncbi:MAG TPA: ABC transporter substrate-binding protein [Candidatus Binatia bacterium]|jgi:ABC-type nitrate/sulfonate/bicarbonate transport system substrate-binding protein
MAICRFVILTLFALSSLAEAQELKKIHVAIPAVTPAATTFAVAKEKGYYREEGLDVELIVMPSAVGTQALIGGNVKFSTVGGAGLPPALRGAPIRFLFTTFNRPMFWLFAKPEIRSIADLKGKRVGVSSLGSGPDSILRDLLQKHGLEGGREVVIMPMGAGTARFAALQAGSVDAAMLSIPSNFLAHEAGFRQLVSFIDSDLVELQGSILTSAQLLESEPMAAERFVRGSVKGFLTFRDNRPGTIQVLTRFLRLKEEMVTKIYDLVRPGMTPDGTIGETLQKKSIEHIVGRVGVKDPPPLEKIFDFSLTRKINDELRGKGWRP